MKNIAVKVLIPNRTIWNSKQNKTRATNAWAGAMNTDENTPIFCDLDKTIFFYNKVSIETTYSQSFHDQDLKQSHNIICDSYLIII